MFENYEKYLEQIDKKIAGFFEQAKEYIFCKEGCSYCCEEGQYPYSKLECAYLLHGATNLPENKIKEIEKNIAEIKRAKKESSNSTFMYKCPFLTNSRCCVYKYRGLICRTHGLAFYVGDDQNIKIPACVDRGLNYHNVVDETTKMISSKKFKELGFKEEPVAYNLSLKFLLNHELTKCLELDFGENKPLIDWFE